MIKNNVLLTALLLATPLFAKPDIPVSPTAFDGGVISAETRGRGDTIASNRGTPASGSENPAALNTPFMSSLYTTFNLGVTSVLPKSTRQAYDASGEKVFQYTAVGAEKGVIFFEPISRLSDSTTAEMAVDAIGFAGADTWRKDGGIGISIAYLRSSLSRPLTPANLPGEGYDTGNGVRLNIGVRYPLGPTMWGLVLQNAPGFLWWKHHSRSMLPLRIRVGNTWRIRSGILSTLEWEQRHYDEGSDKEDFVHYGAEAQLSNSISLRAGVFGTQIDQSENRHYTAGLTIRTEMGAEVSYAFERFELLNEKISRSFLTVSAPFASEASKK